MRIAWLPIVLAAALALGCAQTKPRSEAGALPQPEPVAGARLAARPCWFEPSLDLALRVECAELRVPERWGDPGARDVRLPVVILRAGTGARWATLIPGGGGPGGSVRIESDEAATTVGNYESIAADSRGDVVIVDQRGAGLAEPAFRCEEMREATLQWLRTDPSVEQEAALWSDAARRCRARLSAGGIAVDAYDAEAVVRDLEALRAALGYEQWNLFATSYAGEIALRYARSDPAAIRALVLDSPSVPGAAIAAPAWFQHVLEGLFARCAADPYCARDFPDSGAALDRLLRRFAARPLELGISDPDALAPIPVTITPVRLLDLLFVAMYETPRAHQIPIMLAAADRGSYDWLHEFARDYVWMLLDPRFSTAMLSAVPCRESVPFTDLADSEREAGAHRWRRAFVGVERVTAAVCRAWDLGRGEPPAAATGLPALVLAGELDPVIPRPDVERAARELRARFVEFPATGHSAESAWWHCLDPPIAGFLADPRAPLDEAAIEACRGEAAQMRFTALSRPESLSELRAPAPPR